jgi:acetylornithine deacetylase/succinyl-diaminopimelate desuccinylase-like protein
MLYGHYDVQPPDPLEDWLSDPFSPEVRDGRIYARGATDNKGNLYTLLKAVERLRRADALPVDVQLLIEGQEEIGGRAIIQHLQSSQDRVDAFVSFDSSQMKADRPMLYTGMRGLLYVRVRARTGRTELHSGMYGGGAANALNVLHRVLAAVAPLPASLRQGGTPLTTTERQAISILDPDSSMLREAGAAPACAGAADAFWDLTLAQPAIDIHGVAGGSPQLMKAVVVPVAEAMVSIRLSPGQDAGAMAQRFEELVVAAAPPGCTVEVEILEATSGYVQDPNEPVLRAAHRAIAESTGTEPLALRCGATIPVLEVVACRDIPIVLTGFGLPDAQVHAANENYHLDMLPVAVRAAEAILHELGERCA